MDNRFILLQCFNGIELLYDRKGVKNPFIEENFLSHQCGDQKFLVGYSKNIKDYEKFLEKENLINKRIKLSKNEKEENELN